MKKALLVARWEFLCTVRRPGYLIVVLALPVFYGGMFALAGLAGRSASASAGRVPTAVVDGAHILDLDAAARLATTRQRPQAGDVVATAAAQTGSLESAAAAAAAFAPAASLVPFGTVEEALGALRRREVAAVFAIGDDYLATGSITAYSRDSGLFAQQGDQRRQTQVVDAIRASLLRTGLAGDRLLRAYAPAGAVVHMRLTPQGAVEPTSDPYGLGPLAGSFGIVLLLSMSIFFSSAFLQQATVADRQNKTIEVLLSSLDSNELLAGKLLGLGGAGLLQVAIYVGLIIAPGAALFSLFDVPASRLLLSLVFYVIGVALFASLMAGTGMLGRTAQEAAQLSALWTIASACPFFFMANIGTAPNGPIARALSLFPLTSPVTMIIRIGGAEVPPLDILLPIAIDLLAIYFVLRAASRIFRTASLMHGNRATLPEFLRWFKAA